jgi:endonuclease-3
MTGVARPKRAARAKAIDTAAGNGASKASRGAAKRMADAPSPAATRKMSGAKVPAKKPAAARGASVASAKRSGTGGARTVAGKKSRTLGGADIRRPVRRMSAPEIDALFERFREANPAPTTELEFSTPYELLVAVALSAQATDVSVNKATRKLFPAANTPKAIAKLGVAGLAPYLTTINFHRTKAKNVVAMAEQLLELHGGKVPREREALEALPGVGRKTANVVLNTAFGDTTLAVDTHIFRVSNRTGLAPGRDVRVVEDELLRVVPDRYLQHAHHWLLLHGRYVCKARTPDCPRCIVRDLCHYPDKTPGTAPPLEVAPTRAKRPQRG